ncbi:YbjQ family protein [Gracilimonas sp. Q87]|uniref:YbjQ family protein n=1 Tax=Gracilimonas sp. Q87 TaxID=3384766 RepID=UPI0039845943
MLFTTVNYDSKDIVQSYGMVDSHIVVGANLFRDAFAGFRDIFGGETKSYKKDINKMKTAGMQEMKEKAKKMGANAIIALNVDLDEVSGSGKSMFMYNMYGTAVKLKEELIHSEDNNTSELDIEFEEFEELKKLINKRDKIEKPEDIKKNLLQKLKENNLLDERLINIYMEGFLESRGLYDCKDFLSSIPLRYYKDTFFSKIDELAPSKLNKFIDALSENNYYDVDKITQLLQSDNMTIRLRGLKFALMYKEVYSKSDISKFKSVLNVLRSDLSFEVDITVIDKMIGSEQKYKCPNCLNEAKVSIANKCNKCDANLLGFLSLHDTEFPYPIVQTIEGAINELENRVKVLEEVL